MTKTGESRYSILFPKYKKGVYIVRKLKEKSSYGEHVLTLTYHFIIGYVKELLVELLKVATEGKAGDPESMIPAPLCSNFERPKQSNRLFA